MSIERINPAGLAPPSGFSHAVTFRDARLVFLAGQTALDRTGRVLGDGVAEQFERALANLLAALSEAGGNPHDLVEMTIFIVDVDQYRQQQREIGKVWKELVGEHYPAAAAVGVSRLWDAEALVEIKGTAAMSG